MKFETHVVESGSSLEEALLAVSSLAKFHAAAIVAQSQGKMSDDVLLPYFYCRSEETINSFFKDGLSILVETMRESWGVTWSALANKLETITSQIGEIFVTLHKETDEKFKVVNHGDFWRANLMYIYDENKSPNSFKCVDFQLSHYGSIGWDLSYFLFLNPNLNLRYSHYDDLIGAYQKSLADFLRSCDCPTPALSIDDINDELDRFSLYGFLKCCTDLPYHICSFKTGIDAENLFKNNKETDELKMKLYSSEKYTCIIKTHIGHLKMRNIL